MTNTLGAMITNQYFPIESQMAHLSAAPMPEAHFANMQALPEAFMHSSGTLSLSVVLLLHLVCEFQAAATSMQARRPGSIKSSMHVV